MDAEERWYFSKESIFNSPSRRCGIDAEKELSYRQGGAKLIQDMGQRLQVTQLVINTAIVYMHRFYMHHTFTRFHRNAIGPAALFLAAKVEEQPRKLEHVIKVAHYILNHHEQGNFDLQSEAYAEKAQELVINENILLQTLGFDVAIDHPHTHVVKCFQMVRNACHRSSYEKQLETEDNSKATTDLAQTSYFMATNSLHMTTMCLQYRPAVVACVCIFIVCKWSHHEIQRFTEGRDWFFHVDPSVNKNMLENLTTEFLQVLDKYPNRLKKIMTSGGGSAGLNEERARQSAMQNTMQPSTRSVAGPIRGHDPMNRPPSSSKSSGASLKTVLSHREYSEKKEKEKRERDFKVPPPSSSSHHGSSLVPPHPMHARSQPSENSLRKLPSDNSNSRSQSNTSRIPPTKLDHLGHRRDTSTVRSDERAMSENSFEKLPSDKLKQSVVDIRHSQSSNVSEWPQMKYSLDASSSKDRKQPDIKKEQRETSKIIPLATPTPKTNDFIPPSSIKSESKIKLETIEKSKIKEESKEPNFLLPKTSFFNDLKDLSNPPDMPPEDIFDNEGDSSGRPSVESILQPPSSPPPPLQKRKYNSPPKAPPTSGSVQSFMPAPHRNIAPIDHPDSKVVIDRISNGNSLQVPPTKSSSRKKDKIRSPHSASKSRSHNAFVEPPQPDHQKLVPKDIPVAKDCHQAKSSALPPAVSLTIPTHIDKNLHTQQQQQQQARVSLNPLSKVTPESLALMNQALKVNIDRSGENCEASIPPSKKHRHDSSSHKHKDKKNKKKSKKEDKHRSREHKEHKEHKKSKKKGKNKDKDKDKPSKEEHASIKVKLVRDKGIYTPEAGAAISRLTESSSIAAPSHSAVDTPGRIKLTISKARLQPQQDSPPRGIPEKSKTHSRKRDRSSCPSEPPPSKYQRPHEVLDPSARWSSQRH